MSARAALRCVVGLFLWSSALEAQGGGASPGAGTGSCWTCKIVTVGDPLGDYTLHECEPSQPTGSKSCNSGGIGETAFCQLYGGGCGGPGLFDIDLAIGTIGMNGLPTASKVLSIAAVERQVGITSAAQDPRLPLHVTRDCRGLITSAKRATLLGVLTSMFLLSI